VYVETCASFCGAEEGDLPSSPPGRFLARWIANREEGTHTHTKNIKVRSSSALGLTIEMEQDGPVLGRAQN